MKHNCFSAGKSISECMMKAYDDEERGVRLKKRLYSTYILNLRNI